jgi:glutamate synthase domain-containing protein 2
MIALFIASFILLCLLFIYIYDKHIQKKNIVLINYPIVGHFRYFFHHIRPFFRQYFGDDNNYLPRRIIDWILQVSQGGSGNFAFDTFSEKERELFLGTMNHSSTPKNKDEIKPIYPILGENRKHPFQWHSYIYKSAMSLGALSFEATSAMAAASCDLKIPFNTGEGGLSIHHLPRLTFTYDKKFLKYKKISKVAKAGLLFCIFPSWKISYIDFLGNKVCGKNMRDLYLFDSKNWLFYTINWEAPLSSFPKPEDLDNSYGQIILQIGSGLYGMRKKDAHKHPEIDWERFQKTSSFTRAIEIKLAQGAKQSGGILKAHKNTPVIATIRGVEPYQDIISPNRFPYYEENKEAEFIEFLDTLSEKSGGKPVGCKIVISNEKNIEPLLKSITKNKKKHMIDFITIDGGDGGSGAAPLELGVLFGKRIYEALEIATHILKKYKLEKDIKILASSKLAAPHRSARALTLGASAIGNARAFMIAAGCIRSGLCSGEHGDCPVGLATMNKKKRKGYQRTWNAKIQSIKNYITAHEKGIQNIAAISGYKSPSEL